MVGILIALQINNWNQNKILNDEEKLILSALRTELLTNQANLANWTRAHEKVEGAIRRLLELGSTDTQESNTDSIDALLATASFFNPSTTFQMSAIDAIIQGGKLSIIKNPDLRQRVSGWSRQVARVKHTESTDYDSWFDVWMPYLRENAYLPQIQNAIQVVPESGEANYIPNIPLGPHQTDQSDLINDRKFQNVLLHRLWVQGDILQDYRQLSPSLTSLIEMIEGDLAP